MSSSLKSCTESGNYFWPGILLAVILISSFLPLQAAERETTTLEISAGQSLDIDWDHSKNYRLQLPSNLKGNWLLSIEQRGVDVTPVLISSMGEQIITTDAAILSVGIDRLVFDASVWNGASIELPLKTKIISPGSLRVKLQAVYDPELYLFLRQVMTATALLQDKDTVIPSGVVCDAKTDDFGKDPGLTTRCFKSAREQYKLGYKKYISLEELDYFLADSVRRQGLFSDAQRLYLPLIRQQGDTRIRALSLHGLAWTVWQSGENNVAESFTAQAVSAYQQWQQQDTSNKGVVYQLLAVQNIGCLILHYQELLDRAEACYLELQPDVSMASDYNTQSALIGSLGGIYYQRGDVVRARIQFEKSYDLYTSIGMPSGQGLALSNIGHTELRAGNLDAALKYYRQAVDLGMDASVGIRFNSDQLIIANIYRLLGESQRARQIFLEQESLATAAGDKGSLAYLSEQLALIADREGDFEQARKYYLLGMQYQRESGNKSRVVNSILVLAEFEARQGGLELAGDYLAEANQLVVDVETLQVVNWLAYINGQYSTKIGDFPAAIQFLQTALAAYQLEGAEYNLALVNIAMVDAYKGNQQFSLAEQHGKKAIHILTEIRPENVSLDLRASFSSRQRDAYEKLINLYLEAWQQEPSAGWSRKALLWTERARAQTLREAVRQSNTDMLLSPELQQQRRDLSDRLNALATIRLKVMEKQKQNEIISLNRRYEDALVLLERFDQKYLPDFKTALPEKRVDIDNLLGEMAEDRAILSMFISADNSVLWVLAAGEVKTYLLPESSGLFVKVSSVLKALSRPGGYREVESELAYLGEVLDPQLPVGVHKLRIIADGVFNELPFAALQLVGQPGEPWINRYVLSRSPYFASVVVNQAKVDWKGIRIFADPDYKQASILNSERKDNLGTTYPSEMGLYRLRGSAVEAKIIAELAEASMSELANIEILSGASATRAAVLDGAVGNTDILHFATHGIFNSAGSSLAGLALSVVDQQGKEQPWLLTAQELYHAPINAKLVVMSACDAGSGKLAAGEGLLGMVRAFMYAGVGDVVSSQWKVSDRSAVAFMRSFYTALFEKNLSVSQALRQAQLNFVQSDSYSDPFYWASFSNFQQ